MAPPKKLLYGFGVNDSETPVTIKQKDGSFKMCRIYSRWGNMLKRCYSESAKGTKYGKCKVDTRWKRFSEYRSWFLSNEVNGLVIDKDLLSGKLYSPETCLFIPDRVNTFIQEHSITKELPSGVHFNKEKGKFCSRVYKPFATKRGEHTHCGYTDTAFAATVNYLKKKSQCALLLSEIMEEGLAKELLKERYQEGSTFYKEQIRKAKKVDRSGHYD